MQVRRGLVLPGKQENLSTIAANDAFLLQHVFAGKLQHAATPAGSSVASALVVRPAHSDAWPQPQQLATRFRAAHAFSDGLECCLASCLAQCSYQISSCWAVGVMQCDQTPCKLACQVSTGEYPCCYVCL
jgi:hypothetical protein